MLQKIIKFLIIVGTASLIYFQPITSAGEFSFETIRYRSDFVFLAAASLWVAGRVFGLIRPKKDDHDRLARRMFAWMWLFVVFTSAATVLSRVTYDLWFEILGLSSLVKILLGIVLAQVTYSLARGNAILYQWLVRAFYISAALVLVVGVLYLVNLPILLSYISLAPEEGKLALVSYGSRFVGFASNPAQVVLTAVVAISFVWVMTLHNVIRGKWGVGLVQLLYCGGMAVLAYWSLTRSALIVLTFAMSFGAFMTWYCLRERGKLLGFFLFPVVMALVAGISWNLLPQELTRMFVDRFHEPDARLYVWQYYLDIALRNPLGVGFNYEQMFVPWNPYSPGRLNPHNAFLAAWMYGGIGGLLSVLMFLLVIFKSIRIELSKQREQSDMPVLYVGAVTALLSTWVFYMFVGGVPFADFTHSILLALVLAGRIRFSEILARSRDISKMHSLQKTTLHAVPDSGRNR